jgi:hypothetical protein
MVLLDLIEAIQGRRMDDQRASPTLPTENNRNTNGGGLSAALNGTPREILERLSR